MGRFSLGRARSLIPSPNPTAAYYRRFAALYKTAQEVPGAIDREGVSGVPDEDLKDFEEWWKKAGAECKDAQEGEPGLMVLEALR